MKESHHSRRFLAAFFLLLFSLCVTPKRFLHDMLANHKDAQAFGNTPLQQVSQSGFRCQVDDLVVEAPFLPGLQFSSGVTFVSAPLVYAQPIQRFIYCYLSEADNRGPPADFCS